MPADAGSTSERAERELALSLDAAKRIADASRTAVDPVFTNHMTARNILREELGYFGSPDQCYNLTEADQARLLAHCRQDAAFDALNGASALRELQSIKHELKQKEKWPAWVGGGSIGAIIVYIFEKLTG